MFQIVRIGGPHGFSYQLLYGMGPKIIGYNMISEMSDDGHELPSAQPQIRTTQVQN